MKRLGLISLMFIFASSLLFTSCEKEKFDYPMETLYGTWEGTAICLEGTWYDLTNVWYKELGFSITFYSDGTYYGKGSFGTGRGTYEAVGKTITTYVDGEEYLRYEVIKLADTTAELVMYDPSGDSAKIKVRKRN